MRQLGELLGGTRFGRVQVKDLSAQEAGGW